MPQGFFHVFQRGCITHEAGLHWNPHCSAHGKRSYGAAQGQFDGGGRPETGQGKAGKNVVNIGPLRRHYTTGSRAEGLELPSIPPSGIDRCTSRASRSAPSIIPDGFQGLNKSAELPHGWSQSTHPCGRCTLFLARQCSQIAARVSIRCGYRLDDSCHLKSVSLANSQIGGKQFCPALHHGKCPNRDKFMTVERCLLNFNRGMSM